MTEKISELLSVVVCVGQRHDEFGRLMADYDAALRELVTDYEFVVVFDGNYPEALEELTEFAGDRSNVHIVQLSRPFGDSVSVSVGLESSRGELIMTLPCYYQVDPRSIGTLIESLGHHDMIEGRRWPRRDSKLNRFATWLYHRIVRFVTGYRFRDIGCCARIMRRRVADEVLLYGEQNAFLPILASHRGFTVVERNLPQSERDPYTRVYGAGLYARRFLDIFTVFFLIRFTKAPLRFFGVIGSLFLAAGLSLATWVVVQRLFFDIAAAGRPALLFGVVFLVLGVQLFAIGLIGELIIFTHGRELKEYSVAKVVGAENDADAGVDPEAGGGPGISRRQADVS